MASMGNDLRFGVPIKVRFLRFHVETAFAINVTTSISNNYCEDRSTLKGAHPYTKHGVIY